MLSLGIVDASIILPSLTRILHLEWTVADAGGRGYCRQGCSYGCYNDLQDKFPDVILLHGWLVYCLRFTV